MDNAQRILEEAKKRKVNDKESFNNLKIEMARTLKLPTIPTDMELATSASDEDRDELKHLLTSKPVRTIAGVAPIALMTKPHKCPHGTCIYCPGGPDSAFGNTPQSYTGTEPATKRAIRNNFDPYLQVMNRLEQYVILNQHPDKVEIIMMGGTFLSLHETYKTGFVKYIFKALNDFGEEFYPSGKLDREKFNTFFEQDINRADK